MNKVIRSYSKFAEDQQSLIYSAYFDGKLERTSLPYKGEIKDGVIYVEDSTTYLIPISTIQAAKFAELNDNSSSKVNEPPDIEEIETEMIDEDSVETSS